MAKKFVQAPDAAELGVVAYGRGHGDTEQDGLWVQYADGTKATNLDRAEWDRLATVAMHGHWEG